MPDLDTSIDIAGQEKYYSLKCGVASFCAKYLVAIFHPLELLKTRFQSHDGKSTMNQVPKYMGVVSGLKTIYRTEGFAGLYKGVHISAFVSAFASFCFFGIYETMKLQYEKQGDSPMMATSKAGTYASILTVMITQPIWVIKTRVILNTQKIGELQNIKKKTKQIYRQQKIRGFSKGMSLNLFLSLGGALRVYIYQGTKILFTRFISQKYDGVKHLISGGMSKLITTFLSYPLTTIRTRIQQNQFLEGHSNAKYKNLSDIGVKIIKQEGIFGFYKGLAPNLIRGIPMRSVYFYSYELFKSFMIDKDVIQKQRSNKSTKSQFLQ